MTNPRKRSRVRGSDHAFSRLELLAVLVALVLLAVFVVPALAGPRERSARAQCANNLRQIAAASHIWSNDHGDRVPWEVALADGGTKTHSLGSNPWLHFSWLSNELISPIVLFCPSDSGRPAQDFSGDPAKGYLHPNFANRSTSYLLSHSSEGWSGNLMAADWNLKYDATVGSCANFQPNARMIARISPNLAWTTNGHNLAGNLVRLDGRVEQLSNNELRASNAARSLNDLGTIHYITPH